MKICPNCKAQLTDDTVFCTGCGQKLEIIESSADVVCPKCGNPCSSDTQFCTKCGVPIGGAPQAAHLIQPQIPSPGQPSQPTTKRAPVGIGVTQNTSKNPIMLIVGIVAVLIIGGLLYFNMGGSGETSDIPKTAEDFVSVYNRVIKDTAKAQGADAKNLSIGKINKDKLGASAKFAGKKVDFFCGEGEDGSLIFQFMIGNDLESKAFFAVMEGFVKASGGNSDQVMKGLGILSGKKYNLPAHYEKEYTYNNNLQYKVTSMEGVFTVLRASIKKINKTSPSSSVTPSSSSNSQNVSQESVQQVPETQGNALQLAQKELEEYGVSCPVIATSYGHNSNGFLAVCSHTTRPLVLVDRTNRQVATFKAQNKTLERFVQSKNESGSHSIIIDFWIQNAVRDSDASLGTWSGNIHKFPIYCLYKFDSSGEVIPGRLTSGRGEKPSHYQEFLQEQRSVDLANLFLTEMMTLWEDAQKRNVTIK